MPSDLITVVMPVYNGERYLRPALESILRQTWREFELLAIDDCSTDSSRSIIAEYAGLDARVRLIPLETNCGTAAARNHGIEQARGEFIAMQDADDLSFPRRLETQAAFLRKNPEIALAGTRAYIIDENGDPIAPDRLYAPADIARDMFTKKNRIRQGSTMFRAELGLRYREKFQIAEDLELYLRLLSSGRSIANLPEVLYQYRLARSSVTASRKLEQAFYAEAAVRFCRRRMVTGGDEYETWSPAAELRNFSRLSRGDLRLTDAEFNYRIGLLYQYFYAGIFTESLREARELARRYPVRMLGPRWSALLAWVRLRSKLGLVLGRNVAPGADWPGD